MKSLVQRLRSANYQIENLALLDVYGRVSRVLLDASEFENGRRVIRRKLAKQDIAKMVGASREMVSRVMRDLEAGGFLKPQDGYLILDEHAAKQSALVD